MSYCSKQNMETTAVKTSDDELVVSTGYHEQSLLLKQLLLEDL